jgi:hypothetical protein
MKIYSSMDHVAYLSSNKVNWLPQFIIIILIVVKDK